MPALTHYVSLQNVGGVETHFVEFIRCALQSRPEWRHSLLNPDRGMHRLIRRRLDGAPLPERYEKYRWGLKLPWFRVENCRRAFKRYGSDLVLIWNRSARSGAVLDATGPRQRVYWEHGAAWFADHVEKRALFLQRVPVIIANSRAAARMLELRWNYRGDIAVCRNALRPSLLPSAPAYKKWPRQRPVRLGLVGRLTPVKGVALALHALKSLRAGSLDAELHIAGAGPERERLRELAVKLDIEPQVHFHGVVSEMRSFYNHVDCLLHPALREPFGLAAIEAAALGCPVIAASVDGLPEAVLHGISGLCIPPRLPLSDYEALGGSMYDLPDEVYDPQRDALSPPRLVDPQQLADTVSGLFSTPESFERLSRSAAERVPREFDFRRHVNEVMTVLERTLEKAGGVA